MIMMRKCRTLFCISQRNTSEGMTQNNVSPIFRYPERVLRMDAKRQAFLAGNVASTPPGQVPPGQGSQLARDRAREYREAGTFIQKPLWLLS